MVNCYEAELTDEAIRAVCAAADVRDYQAAQLRALGALATEVETAAGSIEAHLARPRPWQEIAVLEPDMATVGQSYIARRQELLEWQEQQTNQARARVKARVGFSTLTADRSHQVLRPLERAQTDTTAEAVAPSLEALKDPFLLNLGRAEDEANELLDRLLSEGTKPLVVKVNLTLRNREVTNEAEIDALLAEIRERLLEHVRAGARVRLT